MIDIKNEQLLTLSEAANTLPSRPHSSTIHRWRLRGIRGQRLETLLIGGRRYTSVEALGRFFARTTIASAPAHVEGPSDRSRQSEIAAAEAEVDQQ